MIIREDGVISITLQEAFRNTEALLKLQPHLLTQRFTLHVKDGKTVYGYGDKEIPANLKVRLLRYLHEEKSKIIDVMLGLLPEGANLAQYMESDTDPELEKYLESRDREEAVSRLLQAVRGPELEEVPKPGTYQQVRTSLLDGVHFDQYGREMENPGSWKHG